MPTQLLVQFSILFFSAWVSLEWLNLRATPLQSVLISALALGLLAQYLGFILKPNLPKNFSQSIFPPWAYIFMSFTLVLACGIFARENISALTDGARRPFSGFELFSIFKDWTVNGQFPFSSIWAQSSSFSDLAANIAKEARSLGVVKWFDLLFVAGLSGVFIKNGLASFRYVLTDEDHAVRAARFLKVGKVEKAVVEGGIVVDRQTYLANLAHVYLAAQEYQKFLNLCSEQVERGPLLHLDFSEAGRAQALIVGYLVSYEVPLSRGYEIYSQVVKGFGDLADYLYFWRFYSVTQKLSLGEICSLYPDDDGISELFDYIRVVDNYLLVDDRFFSEVEEKFGSQNPAIYLITAVLIAVVGAESKTDRRVELAGQSIQRLLARYIGDVSSGYNVRSVEPLAAFAILESRLAFETVLSVPDKEVIDVVNATVECLPKNSKMVEYLQEQLKVSAPS